MNSAWFHLVYFCIRSLARLPLSFLYRLSDLLYPLVFYVLRYRKRVVLKNLRNAFPERDEEEIQDIVRKFYHHFCDVLVETIKMLDFTPQELAGRIRYENPEILDQLYAQQKSIIMVAGHYGNWEWLAGLRPVSAYHTIAVYKPLNSRIFDEIMKHLRSKFDVEVVPMKKILKVLLHHASENRLTLSCFIADQSPVMQEVQYWTTFLNQDTPVYMGIEKIARKTNQPVLFLHPQKIKRGHYRVKIIPLTLHPETLPPYQITELHTRTLETIIQNQPELWLWSHRRWKLSRNIS